MSVKKGMPTAQIELAGKRYDLRYDIDSMAEVEITAQALSMNAGRSDFYGLLDAPYNVREQIVLLMAGINGARRDRGDTSLLNPDGSKALLQAHFDYIRERQHELKEWQESIKLLNAQLMDAARLGAGLVPPSMRAGLKAPKEQPSATN